MNMPKTPLVQKLILLMLILIFGCLVLLLINGQKQIEALRAGPNIELSTNGSNSDAAIRQAFPKMRSSRDHGSANSEEAPVKTADVAPGPELVKTDAPAAVTEPIIVPAPVAVEAQSEAKQSPSVFGRVILVGTPPPEIPIRFDPTCGAMHTNRVTTTRFVVSPDGGLANVFVYISTHLRNVKPATTPVLLDQQYCVYHPYVVGAMVGQPIQIRNSDPLLHNVHASPRINGNDEFNFAQPNQGDIDERKFAKPELFVRFKCEVHDWMMAYVCVSEHPYFAVTDTNGFFELPEGLPSGRYELTAAHLKAGKATQRFTFTKNHPTRIDFRLSAEAKGPLASTP